MKNQVFIFITEDHLRSRVDSLINWLDTNRKSYHLIHLKFGFSLKLRDRLKNGRELLQRTKERIEELKVSNDDILFFTSHEGFEFSNLELWFPEAIGHPRKVVLQHGTFSPSECVSSRALLARKFLNKMTLVTFGINLLGYGYNNVDANYYVALQDHVAKDISAARKVKSYWVAPYLLLPNTKRTTRRLNERLCLLVLQDFYLAGMIQLNKFREGIFQIIKAIESEGYTIIIKPHPKSPKYEFLNSYKMCFGDLQNVLLEYEPNWIVSFYSSALLEAEALGFNCKAVYFPGIRKKYFWHRSTTQIKELNLSDKEFKYGKETTNKDNVNWSKIYEDIIS